MHICWVSHTHRKLQLWHNVPTDTAKGWRNQGSRTTPATELRARSTHAKAQGYPIQTERIIPTDFPQVPVDPSALHRCRLRTSLSSWPWWWPTSSCTACRHHTWEHLSEAQLSVPWVMLRYSADPQLFPMHFLVLVVGILLLVFSRAYVFCSGAFQLLAAGGAKGIHSTWQASACLWGSSRSFWTLDSSIFLRGYHCSVQLRILILCHHYWSTEQLSAGPGHNHYSAVTGTHLCKNRGKKGL